MHFGHLDINDICMCIGNCQVIASREICMLTSFTYPSSQFRREPDRDPGVNVAGLTLSIRCIVG